VEGSGRGKYFHEWTENPRRNSCNIAVVLALLIIPSRRLVAQAMQHACKKITNAYTVFAGRAEGKKLLKGLAIDGRIIFKWILKKFRWICEPGCFEHGDDGSVSTRT
jgi:hypothetical protein